MKRYLGLILGLLFVFAFAASAFADVTITGELKMWNWYTYHVSRGNGTLFDFDGDGIVDDAIGGNLPADNIIATICGPTGCVGTKHAAKNNAYSWTRVRLGADIKMSDNVKGMIELETMSGPEGGSADFYEWGSLNSKQSTMNLRQAWINYTGSGLLGIPAGIKIGHMPLILGLGKFFNNTRYGDDAIVFYIDPTKQLHVGVLTFKVQEASQAWNSDDVDVYAAVVTYKVNDTSNIGLNYVRVNDPDGLNVGLQHLQNLMLHGQLGIGNLTLRAEGDIQFGKLNEGEDTEEKARGFLAYVDAAYKLEPVTLRLAAAYGSGDADSTDGKNKNFINFLGPDMNVAWIYEYQIMSASGGGNTSGLTNTTMLNLGADFAPMKDLKVSVDGYYLRASKTGDDMSKNLGTELDAKVAYNLSKGLTWTIMAGYFVPGGFYQDTIDIMTTGTNLDVNKRNVFSARSDITLSF